MTRVARLRVLCLGEGGDMGGIMVVSLRTFRCDRESSQGQLD